MGQYIRHAIVPMEEVIEKIIASWGAERRTKAHLSSGHTVGIVSLRMRTFGRAASHRSGIHCKACGLRAQYFAVEGFKGRIAVINPEKSEIAQKINIKQKGNFAIKAR